MGTNYYLVYPDDEDGRPSPQLHIGKSSSGWCFALRVYPERGLTSWNDWWRLLEARPDNAAIKDEYGDPLTLAEMWAVISLRHWNRRPSCPYGRPEERFLADNHAEWGPNNLLRARIGGRCVGHGEGTWDYIEGEFS